MILCKPRAHAVKMPGSPQLVALSEGINIALDKPIVLIGRHQECDILIPSRKISRRHCCIALVADHLVVRDLGSTNGIRINGIKVVEGNLRANDELTIGNMRYQLRWTSESEQAFPAAQKNGIKAARAPAKKNAAPEESFDLPMPLPDVALAHPILQAKPKSPRPPNPNDPKAGSLEIPDSVDLRPLDPP
jgi:predicted component of type VI protein secretion system